jgi:hypothetical protein
MEHVLHAFEKTTLKTTRTNSESAETVLVR